MKVEIFLHCTYPKLLFFSGCYEWKYSFSNTILCLPCGTHAYRFKAAVNRFSPWFNPHQYTSLWSFYLLNIFTRTGSGGWHVDPQNYLKFTNSVSLVVYYLIFWSKQKLWTLFNLPVSVCTFVLADWVPFEYRKKLSSSV